MKFKGIIILIGAATWLLGLGGEAWGAYFPDPVPTAEWDLLGGEIFGGAVPIGGEVAGWDQSGVLRFRADVDTLANFFGLAAFFGPPIGSLLPTDFTWRIFDGLTVYTATVTDGTTWERYQGGRPGGTYTLNLELGESQGVVPEPLTVMLLGLLGGSGAIAWIRKRFED